MTVRRTHTHSLTHTHTHTHIDKKQQTHHFRARTDSPACQEIMEGRRGRVGGGVEREDQSSSKLSSEGPVPADLI